MRLTYTSILNQYLRNVQLVGSTDTNILADFQFNLGQRYQLVLAKLKNFKTQQQLTASTVVDQQFYSYPPGTMDIESVTVTVGSRIYPLDIVNSQYQWDIFNATSIQASAFPGLIFPRRDDFGIWPIPQGVYTIAFNQHIRDRNLLVADYTTGTVTATSGSTTITGSGTTFTAGMTDRWFTVTDTSIAGHGLWYRLGSYSSATVMTLDTPYFGTTGSGLTYIIGESPEIPEEGHVILVDGPTADFYGGSKKDSSEATLWNNKFWTGDMNNPNRDEGNTKITGGLIGLINRYSDRNNERIINRRPRLSPLDYQVWGTTLS